MPRRKDFSYCHQRDNRYPFGASVWELSSGFIPFVVYLLEGRHRLRRWHKDVECFENREVEI